MMTFEKVHASTQLLDFYGAPKTQFVFISKEEFEEYWGCMSLATMAEGLVYDRMKQLSVPIFAAYCIDHYDFVFIDPQDLIDQQKADTSKPKKN